MCVYSCNALSAQFFPVDRALNSCFMIMIMIMNMKRNRQANSKKRTVSNVFNDKVMSAGFR